MARARSLALALLLTSGSLVLRSTEAWTSSVRPRAKGVVDASSSRTSASPLSGASRRSTTRVVTRWDEHLDLARREHRRKNWGQVRLLCSRVISIADDWNAVEQAYLRLALVEQKDMRVDAARKAFQEGTAACPSSDTLFMAWALMESKFHNARSRKSARALLRRAVALNPKRHSDILKWRVFLDWKEVSEATVGAVRSALATGQTVITVSSVPSPPPSPPPSTVVAAATTAAAATAGVSAGVVAAAAAASAAAAAAAAAVSTAGGFTSSPSRGQSSSRAAATAAESAVSAGRLPQPRQNSTQQAVEFLSTWGKQWSEEKERGLATKLLAICKAVEENGRAVVVSGATSTAAESGSKSAREVMVAAQAARFKKLAEELEKAGKGVVGGAEGSGRELSGSWRLVLTTCMACDRVLTRAGSEVYQRLTPPITDITPRACEPPVPFRCEVLLRPARPLPSMTPSSPRCEDASELPGKPNKLSVAYSLRGWAHVPVCKRDKGGRALLLRQQVAPRSATLVDVGSSTMGSSCSGCSRVPSPTPPPAMFSALGQVARGGKGLERMATQEVTYVGKQLRIGRTRDGEVYVYERCAWPEDLSL